MRITSVSRNEGLIGDEVIIRGIELGAMSGKGSVTFNGVLAQPTSWEEDEIHVAVPAGAVTGPLTVAYAGEAVEVQFTVDTIPHGKERTFQAIETGQQKVVRPDPLSTPPLTPIASANPEATSFPIPQTPTHKDTHAEPDETQRKKEAEDRVVQPPVDGQIVVPDNPPAVPGKTTPPVVISGAQGPHGSAAEPVAPPPAEGKIVAQIKQAPRDPHEANSGAHIDPGPPHAPAPDFIPNPAKEDNPALKHAENPAPVTPASSSAQSSTPPAKDGSSSAPAAKSASTSSTTTKSASTPAKDESIKK